MSIRLTEHLYYFSCVHFSNHLLHKLSSSASHHTMHVTWVRFNRDIGNNSSPEETLLHHIAMVCLDLNKLWSCGEKNGQV